MEKESLGPNVNAAAIDKRGPKALGGWGYATFYDDFGCKQNGGVAVSMGNPACVSNEFGRHSIFIQPGSNQLVTSANLIWSPGSQCDCQNHCEEVNWNGGDDYCWPLHDKPSATSFRFVTDQDCPSNNC
ncbi:hypothetical protein K461DRAFT_270949 [Myriangium duriaei CBS 260.36]|uniref:Uncharacterized protein n=1 Tax=Myriangium duriaei CBS 260.36 TaxID=1168546 RepID=A0A9P4IVP2_9PEZI|nr:hypothetical protein K461DRAFT_270949 [Myriangium duriaei CBS 260.36]